MEGLARFFLKWNLHLANCSLVKFKLQWKFSIGGGVVHCQQLNKMSSLTLDIILVSILPISMQVLAIIFMIHSPYSSHFPVKCGGVNQFFVIFEHIHLYIINKHKFKNFSHHPHHSSFCTWYYAVVYANDWFYTIPFCFRLLLRLLQSYP